MEKPLETKRKHTLTIISSVITGVNVFSLMFLLYCLFTTRPFLIIAICIEVFIAISSFIFVFIAKKERFKKLWLPLLFVNIFVLGSTPFSVLLGLLIIDANQREEKKQSDVNYLASIEYVQKNTSNKGTQLFNNKWWTEPFYYFDYDGKVAEKFVSLKFNKTTYQLPNDSYVFAIYDQNSTRALFSEDFTYLKIHAYRDGLFYGRYEATNYYVLDTDSANAFRELYTNIVEEQRTACLAKEKEVKDSISIENAANSLLNEEYNWLTFFGEEYKVTKDYGKTVLTYLKNLDSSKFTLIDEGIDYLRKGFKYESPNGSNDYSLSYHETEGCVEVSCLYTCPYGNKYQASKYYLLDDETIEGLKEIINSYQ